MIVPPITYNEPLYRHTLTEGQRDEGGPPFGPDLASLHRMYAGNLQRPRPARNAAEAIFRADILPRLASARADLPTTPGSVLRLIAHILLLGSTDPSIDEMALWRLVSTFPAAAGNNAADAWEREMEWVNQSFDAFNCNAVDERWARASEIARALQVSIADEELKRYGLGGVEFFFDALHAPYGSMTLGGTNTPTLALAYSSPRLTDGPIDVYVKLPKRGERPGVVYMGHSPEGSTFHPSMQGLTILDRAETRAIRTAIKDALDSIRGANVMTAPVSPTLNPSLDEEDRIALLGVTRGRYEGSTAAPEEDTAEEVTNPLAELGVTNEEMKQIEKGHIPSDPAVRPAEGGPSSFPDYLEAFVGRVIRDPTTAPRPGVERRFDTAKIRADYYSRIPVGAHDDKADTALVETLAEPPRRNHHQRVRELRVALGLGAKDFLAAILKTPVSFTDPTEYSRIVTEWEARGGELSEIETLVLAAGLKLDLGDLIAYLEGGELIHLLRATRARA